MMRNGFLNGCRVKVSHLTLDNLGSLKLFSSKVHILGGSAQKLVCISSGKLSQSFYYGGQNRSSTIGEMLL